VERQDAGEPARGAGRIVPRPEVQALTLACSREECPNRSHGGRKLTQGEISDTLREIPDSRYAQVALLPRGSQSAQYPLKPVSPVNGRDFTSGRATF
jgi:hypothetical protein